MKRIICTICAFAMAFSLCACGNKTQSVIDMQELQKSMTDADKSLPEMKISGSWDQNAEKAFSYLSDMEYNKIHGFFLAYAADGMAYEIAVVQLKDKSDADAMEDSLNEIIPDNPNMAYDMYKVISAVVDNGEFLEVQRSFARNIIIGFARFNGESVGVVANQPSVYAGVLDCNASRKAARFVRFCDCFNIPIVSLVDVPGFLPGTGQEYNAVIDHGAKLLYAYGEATVPKVTVTLRKSYGGSHIVMGCKQLRADLNYAWPSAEIAVMGASGAVAILDGKEAKTKEDPKAFLAEKEKDYNDLFTNPYKAAEFGYVDDVIEPRNTRFRICRALAQLANKRETRPAKKHGNIPL